MITTSNITIPVLQTELAEAINALGGFQDDDSDIPVPKSELMEEVESEKVDPQSIALAVPQDKANPYDNRWIKLDDKTLKALKFADYDILAFSVGNEDFNVTEPTYEE